MPGSGPSLVKAGWHPLSWGSQMDLVERLETDSVLSPLSPATSSPLSLASGARVGVTPSWSECPLLQLSGSEEVDVESIDMEEGDLRRLMEVMTGGVEQLHINWPAESKTARPQSKLDEWF